MTTACASCGSGPRLTDVMTLQGVEIRSDYCGACGATWGKLTLDKTRAAKDKQKKFHKALKAGGLKGVMTARGAKLF